MNFLSSLHSPTASSLVDLARFWWRQPGGSSVTSTEQAMEWLIAHIPFRQHQLCKPAVADDLLEFCSEHQGTYTWAFDPMTPSRTVYGRARPDSDWGLETSALDVFLAQIVVFEAAVGCAAPTSAFASCIHWRDILQALSGLERVLEHWTWPTETRFYASNTALAFSTCEPESWGDLAVVSVGAELPTPLPSVIERTQACWTSLTIDGVCKR